MRREVVAIFVPLLVRVLLLWQGSQDWLGRRIEISTPVNQWMRGRESIAGPRQMDLELRSFSDFRMVTNGSHVHVCCIAIAFASSFIPWQLHGDGSRIGEQLPIDLI